MLTRKYSTSDLEGFVRDAIGDASMSRQWMRVDRLITLWQQANELAAWFDENIDEIGSKMYKETLTAYNSLMTNIRNLENDLDVFTPRPGGQDDNALLGILGGNKDED